MPFFTRNKNSGKKQKELKRKEISKDRTSKKFKSNGNNDEEITSDEEETYINRASKTRENNIYEEVEDETPQEKKVRLAKQYLEEIKKQKEQEEDISDEEQLSKAVSQKLKEDVLESSGKLQRLVADNIKISASKTVKISEYKSIQESELIKILKCKYHKKSLTCVVISNDGNSIFTASKDAIIVKWQRLGVIFRAIKTSSESENKHKSCVLTLALSTDNKFLASGDVDGVIHIWNPNTLEWLKSFKKHRDAISGLAFRKREHTLYSASHDRQVMAWSLDEMAFMEHFAGHEDCITGIDSLLRESCITSGGRDESVLVYDIPEEKKLRFTAKQVSIDGVKLVNNKTFVTYGQNGTLALWSTQKKRPHCVITNAHGFNPVNNEPYWLTALAALVNTDLIATGSFNGLVKLWKIANMKLVPLFSVPITGVVNGLEFSSSGSHLAAAVGQEHKLGRWFVDKEAKNCLVVIPFTMVD